MLKLPQHRADAPIVFVHPSDEAWDQEKIGKELGDEAEDDHPIRLYWGGFTRYDLNPKVQSYLRTDGNPTRFHLRRLSWEQWLEAQSMFERSVVRGDLRPSEAYIYACRYGLKRIENGPVLTDSTEYAISDRDMAKLHQYSTDKYNLILDIGQASYQASMPLGESEKKA